jgi:hypothetical protein
VAPKLTNIESDEISLAPELSEIWRRNSRHHHHRRHPERRLTGVTFVS